MKRFAFALAPVALLAACAGAPSGADYRPIIDGPKAANFQSDLSACQQIARTSNELKARRNESVMAGAALGAVAGWADDDMDSVEDVAGAAAIGALFGAAEGASDLSDRREAAVRHCMSGRGHKVVG